ncbi:hypothetical protein BGW37DRAFT_493154 [Umbelopsis sp. PMI_123]|nr:hypothetical protein BGW37DRAFT_493154 [Umbelopsis sp. PMI_123]
MTSTQCSATPIATLPHKTYSQQCLQAPTRLKHCDSDFEYSIHSPPPRFQRELTHIFPAMRRQELKRILVVPVIQRCDNDMVGVTKSTNAERDVRLELFVEWGKLVVDRLRSVGMWADIMDPASGYPIYGTPGASPYPDVQGTQALLKYDVQNTGCCHVLLHPTWGSKIYPSTMFTTAPADILIRVIEEIQCSQSANK